MKPICLVTINVKKTLYGSTADQLAAVAPNIPMGMLDSYLTMHDVPVEIIDSDAEHLQIDGLLERLLDKDPPLVGIIATGSNPSASTMSMVGAIRFFKKFNALKPKPFPVFVLGGHPTVLPERTLRETGADFIVVGEGYEAITGLYKHVTEGLALDSIAGIAYYDHDRFVLNPMPELIDLSLIPAINWENMNPARYRAHNWHCFADIDNRSPYAIIWTNQGCPYPCDFCSINNVFGKRKFRYRSMQSVVDEIDHLVNDYGVRNLKILDELFAIKHPRIEEFCNLLEERNYDLNMWCFARTDSVTPQMLKRLKKVGVNWVAYGFESFDNDILQATDKRIRGGAAFNVQDTVKMTRDAGMSICADVIAGLWGDNETTILKTRDFMYDNLFEWVNIYPCFAYPGTPLYARYVSEGHIEVPKKWDIYGLYSYECVPLPTKYLSSAEVLRLRDSIFEGYYKEPEILSMLERKFGPATRKHVEDMVKVPLRRRILEEGADTSQPRKGPFLNTDPAWYRGELIV